MNTRSIALNSIYLWLILFGLIPLVLILGSSFLSRHDDNLVSLPFSLHAYTHLFTPQTLTIFWRSLLIAMSTTVLCLCLAFPFCHGIVRSKYPSALMMLVIIPFWTSSLVRTYALIAILKAKGIINTFLIALHVIDQPLNMLYTNSAVIIGLVYNLLPFMILPLYASMERFDFRLIEAAQDLGASRWQAFWKIFVPGNMQGIIAGSLLVLLPAMTLFYIPNVLGGARSVLLGNLIQDQFLITQNWPQGAATSIVLTAFLFVLLLVLRRYTKGALR
jgi:spermidine/putrescine transport system permease protein